MRSLLPSDPARRRMQLAQHVFAVAGLLALGYCLTVFLDAKFYEARGARNFVRALRLRDVGTTTSRPSAAAPPRRAARLSAVSISHASVCR